MKPYLYGDALTLQDSRDGDKGRRLSCQTLLSLIDTSDPAWPVTADALREMADAGVKIDQTAIGIATKLGAHRLASLDAGKARSRRPVYERPSLVMASGSIVYYIRRSDVIKIGTTISPAQRFMDLLPDEILAVEPGTATEERCRHRQFDHLRCQGEYFRQAPELAAHMHAIRELYGEPDPSWPTTGSIKERRPGRAPLPVATTDIKMTVAEASSLLGVKINTVWGWVRRGLISAVGRNEHGRQLYYAEHFIALRDKSAARR